MMASAYIFDSKVGQVFGFLDTILDSSRMATTKPSKTIRNRIDSFGEYLTAKRKGYCPNLCAELAGRSINEATQCLIAHCNVTLDKLGEERRIKRFSVGTSHATHRKDAYLNTEDFRTWKVQHGVAPLWNQVLQREYDVLVILCGITENELPADVSPTEEHDDDERVHVFTKNLHESLLEHLRTKDSRFRQIRTIKKIDKSAPCGVIYVVTEFEKSAAEKDAETAERQKIQQTSNEKWGTFLQSRNEESAKKLLSENILPNGDVFQQVCKIKGKKSDFTKKICSHICRDIRKSSSIVDVWPAYKWSNPSSLSQQSDSKPREASQQQTDSSTDDIIFVVITTDGKEEFHSFNYKIYQRQKNIFSKESEYVNEQEMTLSPQSKLRKIVDCLETKGESLLKKHSNITTISASFIKSTNFGCENHYIEQEYCIVLTTEIKGYIPISEEPFPSEISGIQVDVREGTFKPCARRGYLRMGNAVGSDVRFKNNFHCGTLGGFIDYQNYNVCCFTCAHVMFPGFEGMKRKRKSWTFKKNPNQRINACVLPRKLGTHFGEVVRAICNNRVDVALAVVEMFEPMDGKFTVGGVQNWMNEESLNGQPMRYESGKTADTKELGGTKVFKVGIKTGLTIGEVKMSGGAAVQKTFRQKKCGLRLAKLLHIKNCGNTPFCDKGDSGSLVFTKDDEGKLVAIGMLEGKTHNGEGYVIPIKAILDAIGSTPDLLKRF